MTIAEKIDEVLEQEKCLKFEHFTNEDAYCLGNIIYNIAKDRKLPVTIEIRKNTQIVYHVALDGTAPDNDKWLERKYNLVTRTGIPSYRINLELKEAGVSFEERFELTTENYAAHGGCFPINVEGTGIIGTVAVSGLEQSEDHALVIAGVKRYLEENKK